MGAAAAAMTSGLRTDNKAPRYIRLHRGELIGVVWISDIWPVGYGAIM